MQFHATKYRVVVMHNTIKTWTTKIVNIMAAIDKRVIGRKCCTSITINPEGPFGILTICWVVPRVN